MPANALTITEITEFSLVPASLGRPANEHAQISLTKAQEGGAQVPNETEIEKAVAAAVAKAQAEADARIAKAEAEAARQAEINKANSEEIAKMNEEKALAKCEARITSAGISKALAPDFRAIEKANPDALARIEAEMVKLVKAANAMGVLTKSIGEVAPASSDSAEARLDALAKARAKADGIDIYKAYALVTKENPELCAQHQKETTQ